MAAVLFSGCSHNFKITHDLEKPLATTSEWKVGEITVELPSDFEESKKPTEEHIEKLRSYIINEIEEKKIFSSPAFSGSTSRYEISGSILDFKRGSGFVRAMIGFGVGSAKVTAELKLVDTEANEVIFAGNFKQKVASWLESGDKSFERIAEDFAKQLQKQLKNLRKKQEKEEKEKKEG